MNPDNKSIFRFISDGYLFTKVEIALTKLCSKKMKDSICKIISLIILSSPSALTQPQEIDYEMLSQRYNITQEKDGIIKLECKLTGKIIIKTENIKHIPSDYNFDLVIDLRTIDTTQYSDLFTFWSEVPPYYTVRSLIIADANGDDRKDVYGFYRNSPYSFPVIYEINSNGSYDSIYKYPDSLGLPRFIGDLENDGNLELVNGYIDYYPGGYNHLIKILAIDSSTGYPTQLKTIYDPTTGLGQPVDISLYDMDGDGYPEMIYFLDGDGDSLVLSNSFQITKYDRITNQFDLVWQHQPPWGTRGFAFGDIDSDGSQNFAASSIHGEVFVYEHIEENNYSVIRIDSLPLSNVYLQLFTNDLDLNDKPELWIGGEGYINGVGSTILYIYEADEDDQYSVVYSIAIIGVISFFASNMVSADIDNDGTDEVLLCIDQHLLIFENKKSGYELYYIKRNELSNQNSRYFSVTTADFDGDNYPETVISMDLIENGVYRGFSRIYKKTSTLDVLDNNPNANNYYLSEAYPNPFNPSTTLSFVIGQSSFVLIKVYDILGKEVKTLLNESIRSGKYEITWDGRNNNGNRVSSGTYFINMVAGDFNKSIKTIMVK
ncbi:MAG: FG-GAP-like repeat-containing protein [Ignavibacteriaceae bacterium]